MTKLLATLMVLVGTSVQAQQACGPRDTVVSHLLDKYDEVQVAVGLMDSSSRLVEVFASPDGATFTILSSTSNGMTCMLSSGTNFLLISPVVPGDPL